MSASRVLVYTGFVDRETITAVLRWKPDGYVVKNDPHLSLLDAVQHLISGGYPLSSQAAAVALELAAITAASPPATPTLRPLLSTTELRVLEALATDSPKTNTELANTLSMAAGTFNTHVGHIYEVRVQPSRLA